MHTHTQLDSNCRLVALFPPFVDVTTVAVLLTFLPFTSLGTRRPSVAGCALSQVIMANHHSVTDKDEPFFFFRNLFLRIFFFFCCLFVQNAIRSLGWKFGYFAWHTNALTIAVKMRKMNNLSKYIKCKVLCTLCGCIIVSRQHHWFGKRVSVICMFIMKTEFICAQTHSHTHTHEWLLYGWLADSMAHLIVNGNSAFCA